MLTRCDISRPNVTDFYNRAWRVVAPERVKMFMWLVGNQAIMTDAERFRRHLAETDVCQVCKGGVETILHVLRDCPGMVGIWSRIVPARRRAGFFSQSLLEWVYDTLGGRGDTQEDSWPTVFVMAAWWGWKWRCDNIFGENRKCRDRVRFVKEQAREVVMANEKREELQRTVGRVVR